MSARQPATCSLDGQRRRWIGLAATLVAAFMGVLDVFIINVAAPAIEADLDATFAQIQLVIAGYVVAYAVGLVTGGRLGDRYGRKRAFVAGTLAFVVASIACSAAPAVEALIGFRIVQGLAAAVMLPQELSIIRVTFTGTERTAALGLHGATVGMGAITGQVIGGALITADLAGLGWRSIFLINVPLGLLAALGAILTVRESRRDAPTRMDLIGALLLSIGTVLLVSSFIAGPVRDWPAEVWASLAVAAGTFAALAAWERRVDARGRDPLLPVELLHRREFVLGMAIAVALYGGTEPLYLVLSYYVQDGLGHTPLISGYTFVPLAVGFTSGSLAVRPLQRRFGILALSAGAVLMVISLCGLFVLLGTEEIREELPVIGAVLLVHGLGQGLIAPPLMGVVLGGVDAADAGTASGALLTVLQIAGAIGVAAVGALFAAVLERPPAAGEAAAGAVHAAAFRTSLVALVALAAATLLLIELLRRRIRPSPV